MSNNTHFFNPAHATLKVTFLVGWSVGTLVGPSVRPPSTFLDIFDIQAEKLALLLLPNSMRLVSPCIQMMTMINNNNINNSNKINNNNNNDDDYGSDDGSDDVDDNVTIH